MKPLFGGLVKKRREEIKSPNLAFIFSYKRTQPRPYTLQVGWTRTSWESRRAGVCPPSTMCEFPAVARPSDKQTHHLEERASCGTQSLWDVSPVCTKTFSYTGLDEMDTLPTWRRRLDGGTSECASSRRATPTFLPGRIEVVISAWKQEVTVYLSVSCFNFLPLSTPRLVCLPHIRRAAQHSPFNSSLNSSSCGCSTHVEKYLDLFIWLNKFI